MSILVRKIRDHLWGDALILKSKSIISRLVMGHKYNTKADAITKCLSTEDDKLSCWEIDGENQIEQAILALITGGRQGSISSMSIVLIPKEELLKRGLYVLPSEDDADTAAESLKSLHRNIISLDYESLGRVQDVVIDCIKQKRKRRKTKSELWEILRKGIVDRKVNVNQLSENLQDEIKNKYTDLRYFFEPDIEGSTTIDITIDKNAS